MAVAAGITLLSAIISFNRKTILPKVNPCKGDLETQGFICRSEVYALSDLDKDNICDRRRQKLVHYSQIIFIPQIRSACHSSSATAFQNIIKHVIKPEYEDNLLSLWRCA
jgi:hypothetical protein